MLLSVLEFTMRMTTVACCFGLFVENGYLERCANILQN